MRIFQAKECWCLRRFSGNAPSLWPRQPWFLLVANFSPNFPGFLFLNGCVSPPLFKGPDQVVKSLILILYLHLEFGKWALEKANCLLGLMFLAVGGKSLLSALMLWICECTLFQNHNKILFTPKVKQLPLALEFSGICLLQGLYQCHFYLITRLLRTLN